MPQKPLTPPQWDVLDELATRHPSIMVSHQRSGIVTFTIHTDWGDDADKGIQPDPLYPPLRYNMQGVLIGDDLQRIWPVQRVTHTSPQGGS